MATTTATTTLLDEIRRIQEDGKTGSLLLTHDSRQITLFCHRGLIEAVSSNMEAHRLGQLLVNEGYFEEKDLKGLLSASRRQKVSIGEAAVRKNLVEQSELTEIVRRQAFQLLQLAIKSGFAVSTFTPGNRSCFAPAQIQYYHLVLELSRSNPTPFEVSSKRFIALKNGRELSHLPWYPSELLVLSNLAQPLVFADLVAATGLPEGRLSRVLGVLASLGLIALLDEMPSGGQHDGALQPTAVVTRSRFPFEHLVPVVTHPVASEKLEVFRDASSIISEQFKTLKVSISEAESAAPVNVITVSSPSIQDGKSLVSSNLALSFSMDQGRRVIIVDCDLRRPSLNKYLGVTLQPGLSEYLTNGNLQPYCYMRRFRNLYFMTAGEIPENPIELLSSERMRKLIEYLKTEFDTIILDAPPMAPISDARIVTGLGDGLLMVIRGGKTAYGNIEAAFKTVDRTKLLGVVFNDVEPRPFQSNYSNGYYSQGYAKWYRKSNVRKVRTSPTNYLES